MNSATGEPAAIDVHELPTISVVMPFLNRGAELRQTTEALTALEYPHLEFILVDDGSSDASVDIAKSFVDGTPGARLVTNPVNVGAGEARNRGLKLATGEYVWFVDSDDEWSPNILMRLASAAARTNADVAICGAMYVDTSGRVKAHIESFQGGRVLTGPKTIEEVLRGSIQGYVTTKLIRRSLIHDDPFPRIAIMEDFCGVVPVLARSKRVVLLDETLYRYIRRAGSITNKPRNPGDFDHVRHTMRRVASDHYERGRNGTVHALRFDYDAWHLNKANAAALNPDRSFARQIARDIAGQIQFSDLLRLSRPYPKVAGKALTLKLLGRVYPYLYLLAKSVDRRALPASQARPAALAIGGGQRAAGNAVPRVRGPAPSSKAAGTRPPVDAGALGRKRGSESSAPARRPDTRIATAAAGHEPETVRTA